MECNCSTGGFKKQFGDKIANKKLKDYLAKGPKGNTKMLIDLIKRYDIGDKSLLDIGGGIGAIQFQLLDFGIKSVQSVDASQAYLDKGKEGAKKLGYGSQIEYTYGDFIQVSEKIAKAEIVTLDKVICCYKDFRNLVRESLSKTKEIYAIIIPKDGWIQKFVHSLEIIIWKITGNRFRSYIHPVNEIESIIFESGFSRRIQKYKMGWLICIYIKDK